MQQHYGLKRVGMIAATCVAVCSSAFAQDGADGSANRSGLDGLEEIVVTANKREESLQSVGQSVTVVSGADLAALHVQTSFDIASKVPSLTINKNDGSSLLVTMRGVGREANENPQSVAGVALHLDGVFMPTADLLRGNLMDIERIEVLRGPQGTVYGQQAIGGVINVVSKRPALGDYSADTEIAFGNHGYVNPRASANVPLGETVAVRAAVSYLRRDGYTKIVNSPTAGYQLDDADSLAARARMLWQPTENLSVILGASVFDEDIADAALRNIEDPGTNPREVQQDRKGTFKLNQRVYSAEIALDLDSVAVKSITSYQTGSIEQSIDGDKGVLAFVYPQIIADFGGPTKTFTQEINVLSSKESTFEWIVGAFYMRSRSELSYIDFYDTNADGVFEMADNNPILPFFIFAPGLPDEVNFENTSEGIRESYSFYGQGTVHLGEKLDLIAGLRTANDRLEQNSRPYFGSGIFGATTVDIDSSVSKVTWKTGLQYQFTPAVMGYATVSTGMKPGGINSTAPPAQPSLVEQTFKPEEATSVELGVKSRFANNRVQLNASAFHYDYRNYQFHTENYVPFSGGIGNLPKSQIFGAELEMTGYLPANLRLDANISVLDGEVTSNDLALNPVRAREADLATIAAGSFPTSPLNIALRTAEVEDMQGKTPAKLPPVQGFARLSHVAQLGTGELVSGVAYTYKAAYHYAVYNTPGLKTPSYDSWDLDLHYGPAGGPWYVGLSITNLEDDDNVNARWSPASGAGFTSDQFFPPRQIVGRVGMRF